MMPIMVVSDTVKRQHVASKAREERNRAVKRYCLIILLFICAALAYVWTRVCVVQHGYAVSKLNHTTAELEKQKSILESEVATLKSPRRLEAVARDRFGMRPPKGDEIVFIEP